MRKQFYWILILPLFVLTQSCEGLFGPDEEKRTLPPITNTGENTFGMKVNGEVWLPSKSLGIGIHSNPHFRAYETNDGFVIKAKDFEFEVGEIQSVLIEYDIQNKTLIPTYIAFQSSENVLNVYRDEDVNEVITNIESKETASGTIISGTFNCEFSALVTEKQYKITGGRFDVLLEK